MASQAQALHKGKEGGTSEAYSGEVLTPDVSVITTEPKSGAAIRAAGQFGHSFHIFTGRGTVILRINNSEITVNSDVTASIGEMTAANVPFIGSALMRVCNVAAFNGGVFVRVEVNWDRNLRFQVMLNYSM